VPPIKITSKKTISWKQILLPVGLVVLVGAITFLPFARQLGFYRDDWYMLWSANTRGADSIIELFSIDRPFMGYTYDLTYRLLGNSTLAWQLYSFLLKSLGAVAVFGIMRLIWPEKKQAAMAASLIYLVYPGFLGQPNAATKTNQLLSLTSELWSIWLSGLAVITTHKGKRVAFILAAIPLSLLNLLLYEYMVGLEALRLCVLWFIPQENERLNIRARVRRLVLQWWPYVVVVLGFLVWRLGFFKSGRAGTDQFSVMQSITSSTRDILVRLGLHSVMDTLESAILAWVVPFEQYATQEKPRLLVIALLAGALVAAIVLGVMWVERRAPHGAEDETARGRALIVCIIGLLALFGAIFPVLAAGRDIHFSGGFDKYTLHASPAVAILISGIIFGFVQGRARQLFLALLLFLGVSTHVLNAYHWERFWEAERTLWWQLSWRAPGIQDGTILLASIPEEGFFEDYEVWGPANLIYRPGIQTVTIGSEILSSQTIWKVWSGSVEERGMRKLDYPRDYNKSLLLALPPGNACLKVVDREDLILPLRYEPRLVPILKFSHVDQIELSAQDPTPPAAIFGPEPAHDWCYYYQNAERAKQASDWQTVAQLGDEAFDAGLTPVDRVEWLPFLEGYLATGNQARAGEVVQQIVADDPLVRQVCDALSRGQYRFGAAIQQSLTQALCSQ
jgi:hypothetical protein